MCQVDNQIIQMSLFMCYWIESASDKIASSLGCSLRVKLGISGAHGDDLHPPVIPTKIFSPFLMKPASICWRVPDKAKIPADSKSLGFWSSSSTHDTCIPRCASIEMA